MSDHNEHACVYCGSLLCAEKCRGAFMSKLASAEGVLKEACAGSEPSAGRTWAEEAAGLLRVTRSQRDDAESAAAALRAERDRAREDFGSCTMNLIAARREKTTAEAERDRLAEALREAVDWFVGREGESATERFERIADDFCRDVRMLRPGKSQSEAQGGYPTDEERQAAWAKWSAKRSDRVRALVWGAALPLVGERPRPETLGEKMRRLWHAYNSATSDELVDAICKAVGVDRWKSEKWPFDDVVGADHYRYIVLKGCRDDWGLTEAQIEAVKALGFDSIRLDPPPRPAAAAEEKQPGGGEPRRRPYEECGEKVGPMEAFCEMPKGHAGAHVSTIFWPWPPPAPGTTTTPASSGGDGGAHEAEHREDRPLHELRDAGRGVSAGATGGGDHRGGPERESRGPVRDEPRGDVLQPECPALGGGAPGLLELAAADRVAATPVGAGAGRPFDHFCTKCANHCTSREAVLECPDCGYIMAQLGTAPARGKELAALLAVAEAAGAWHGLLAEIDAEFASSVSYPTTRPKIDAAEKFRKQTGAALAAWRSLGGGRS